MVEIYKLYVKTPNLKRSNSSHRIQRKKASQPLKSPADRILFLQRTIGNQAVQRLIKSGTLQAKLKIGQPGDKYEQEADRVADAVMRMPVPGVQRQVEPEEEEEETLQPKPLVNQITPLVQVQRQEEPEEEEEMLQAKPLAEEITPLVQRQVEPEEEKEELQAKATSGHISEVNPNLESHIHSLNGGGQPLSESERSYFEPRFGRDFSQVRVHTDAQAAELAQVVNARAFTVGRNVLFGAGGYAPETASGQRLIAHELTHTIQQGSSKERLKQDTPTVDRPHRESRNINRQVEVTQPLPIREDINSPVIARQLDLSMCASDCATPDGTGGGRGKYLLTIYADKEGPFLLLPVTHKVGHSWLKLVDTSGNYWTYGFWPQKGYDPSDLKKDVEGCVHHPDTAHSPTASQTFELAVTEFAAAKAKAVSICHTKPKYNLFGLQCTEFVRQVLDAAGSGTALGFGLIWESPNALDTWIRGNALLLGISVTGATSAAGGQGGGALGLDITYTHRFFSALGNKLRLHWMSRSELSSRMASLSTGVGLEVTTQRVFLPSLYLFGGGIAGEITPGKLGRAGEKLGAGVSVSAGILYNIDEIATVGVEYNLVKDLVSKDPVLHRLMLSARLRLF
ncbi:MAG: DUF4157 domain-containing protein [Deltaproteobacteria bacterium]|nr:DUF4157 domain-containing protein [Deltaproteobacteria bacterium]